MKTHDIFKTIFLVLCLTSVGACQTDSYCKKLQTMAQSTEITSHLKGWVDKNIVDKQVHPNKVLVGGGIWPGIYWYFQAQFNWDVLNFNSDAQIRLVGPVSYEELKGSSDNIKSVFFGERSGYGFLVRLPDSSGFGVEDKFLIPISEEIAVVCRERD